MNGATGMITVMVLLVPLCGILMAITPWLMPKGECFTVTVPESAQQDPRLRGLKRRFLMLMLAVTAVCTVVAAMRAPMAAVSGNEVAFTWLYVAVTMVPVVVGFILMLLYRSRVQDIKQQEGWTASAQLSAAVISGGSDNGHLPPMLPLTWNLLYIPVMLLTVGLIVALYPSMPDQIPMQMDFSGNVSSYMQKSPATAAFPLYVEAFIAVVMVFTGWSIKVSKPDINPKKPATSAYAYAVFARANAIMLLVGGLALNLAIGITMPLASAGRITLGQAGLWVIAAALVFVFGALIVSLKYGQSGSRMFARMQSDDSMPRDEDRFWKLGVFYLNPQDPAFIVPKRFGFGWTMNLARPVTWLLFGGFVVVLAIFCIIVGSIG